MILKMWDRVVVLLLLHYSNEKYNNIIHSDSPTDASRRCAIYYERHMNVFFLMNIS